jgi:hypothetical protein
MTNTSSAPSDTEIQQEPTSFSPTPGMMECGAAISPGKMEQFVSSFQQSTRRWEIIVYPAMFAFVILAGYGFFLIYSLTSDMSAMAHSMDSEMGEHMGSMTKSIVILSEQVQIMSGQVIIMTHTMNEISGKLDTLPPMLRHINTMADSMRNMKQSLSHIDNMMVRMDLSMTSMDESIGKMDKSIGNMDVSISRMDDSMGNMNKSMRVMTGITDQMRRDLTMMNHGMSNIARPASFANSFMPW